MKFLHKSSTIARLVCLVVMIGPALLAQQSTPAQSASSDQQVPSGNDKPRQTLPAAPTSASAANPLIVLRVFTVHASVAWPYDMKQMQTQTVAELKAKVGKHYDVVTDVPEGSHARVFTLDGEVTAWRPGNSAKRLIVGMGSGRESAEIRYWLTDDAGKKTMDRKDTIRAEFWGNAYQGSVGQLAHPFADKIAGHLMQVLQL